MKRHIINKLFFILLLFYPVSSYAQSNKSVVFRNGLSGSGEIIATDGTNQGTLSDAITYAKGSVQTSQIGVANGVAPLDANKMMSAAVSGDSSSSPVTASGTSMARTLSARYADQYNIKDLGAVLDGSASDNAKVQSIYSSLGGGSTVHIPRTNNWNGVINDPDPNKNLTWIFESQPSGMYTPPPGDGDYSISYQGGPHFQTRFLNNKHQDYLSSFFYWNDDPNFTGPYSGNYTQYAAANFRSISGPVSSGNTSPINLQLDSYGMRNSGAYDVGLPVVVNRYGNNSSWGTVINQTDFSGMSPTGFAQWNEFDIESNGYDQLPWSPSYGAPTQGSRCVFCISSHPHYFPGWLANASVTLMPTAQGALLPDGAYYALTVAASDKIEYVWRAWATTTGSTTGLTGSTQPTFPNPSHVFGSISGDVLTVTSVPQGSISVGDYLSGPAPATPIKIIAQTSGTPGGAGVYTLESAPGNFSNIGFYTAPRVTDNQVIWQFGTEYNQSVSSLLCAGGTNTTYDTVVGIQPGVKVGNAVLDTSGAVYNSGAVPIRLAPDQMIDLSSGNTVATHNLHMLGYTTADGGLAYQVNGKTVMRITDTDMDLPSGSTHSVNSFVSGTLEAGAVIITSTLYLGVKSKAEILALSSPSEGQKIFDRDDHEEVTYRCPTTTTCDWFPVEYGSGLSTK